MIERIAAIFIALAAAELAQACDAPGRVGPTLVIPAETVSRLGWKLDPFARQATVAIPASVLTDKPADTLGPILTAPMLMTAPMPQRFAPGARRDLGLYKFDWRDMRIYSK
jgi:hypothetical protein